MVITIANKDPADSNVIIFLLFISFEGLTASLETAIHITIETMATMVITSLGIVNSPLIEILFRFQHA